MILEYSIPARFGIGVGILCNMGGFVATNLRAPHGVILACGVAGMLFTGMGCVNYARAKGHNPLLGLLGLLPPFGAAGLLVVCVLPDKKRDAEPDSAAKNPVSNKPKAGVPPKNAEGGQHGKQG